MSRGRRAGVAGLVLVSLLAGSTSGAVFFAAREVVQPEDRALEVSVALPDALAPTAVVVGTRVVDLQELRAKTANRRGAAGIVSAIDREGRVVGQAVVADDVVLRPAPRVRIDSSTTAESLVLQSPQLVTDSPILVALTLSATRRAPGFAALVAEVERGGAASADHLVRPSAQLKERVVAVAGETARTLQAAVARYVEAPGGPVKPEFAQPAAKPKGAGTASEELFLPDKTGKSSCADHWCTPACRPRAPARSRSPSSRSRTGPAPGS